MLVMSLNVEAYNSVDVLVWWTFQEEVLYQSVILTSGQHSLQLMFV